MEIGVEFLVKFVLSLWQEIFSYSLQITWRGVVICLTLEALDDPLKSRLLDEAIQESLVEFPCRDEDF